MTLKIGSRVKLRPKFKTLLVRDHNAPDRAPLPAEGKSVVYDMNWHRRFLEGSVVVATDPKPVKPKSTETETREAAKADRNKAKG